MMFSVPQFIDVEDKIAGPLTWRQLLWMIGMGAVLLVAFNVFDGAMFIVSAIPIVLIFVAFAFYRPNGFPLVTFIFYSILFLFRPKVSVWERPVRRPTPMKTEAKETGDKQGSERKRIEREKLEELARIMDSRGKK
ncbi:MAG: PrgI family protein [Candidatus Moranbacteria bacterium]|nr:PrgI family protein [Candidatus Moranbacteria bacterium]